MTDSLMFQAAAYTIFQESGKEGLIEWINDADSPTLRGIRKNAAFMYLYGESHEPHSA